MAKSREIVKRRKSVGNIRKITKTMEMIATAKFKKVHNRAVGARPYTEKITQLVGALAGSNDQVQHPLLRENRESGRTVLLVLTSNRGLCGGYNGNIIRLALHQIKELESTEQEIDLRVSGKKGIQYFKFVGQQVNNSYTHFDDKTTYAAVEGLADEFINLYNKREIGAVRVVYMHFISTARHYAEVLELLPLSTSAQAPEQKEQQVSIEDYIFSPSAQEILGELIPTAVRTELFQCFIDSIVSEQVARMTAMKAATDNAEQMSRALTRQYNRARQTQITGELLDIMGGANALA